MILGPDRQPAFRLDRPDEQARFTVRTTAEGHFAWPRTRLALERTIMRGCGRPFR